MAGTSVKPASLAARSRRSPAMSSKRPALLRTSSGWIIPFCSIELASSWRWPASNVVRGCRGLGPMSEIASMVILGPYSCGSAASWRAGAALLASSADRPLPKALRCGLSGFLCTAEDLLCQLNIAFGPARADVIDQNGLSETGRLGQADAARDHGAEHAFFEEIAQVLLHLASKVHP